MNASGQGILIICAIHKLFKFTTDINLLVGGLFGWKWPKTATSISDIFRMIFYKLPAIPII